MLPINWLGLLMREGRKSLGSSRVENPKVGQQDSLYSERAVLRPKANANSSRVSCPIVSASPRWRM
jgi:hypothetical protein